MTMYTQGIHHVTAICGDPQKNLDFYAGILGLRFIKQTVNFDDPTTYHFYYGDGIGSPGSIITFFPWPGMQRGRPGNGQAVSTGFSVPIDSMEFWVDRLSSMNVQFEGPEEKFKEPFIQLRDPDGLQLELIETDARSLQSEWEHPDIPADQAISGIHNVTLWVEGYDQTSQLINEFLGYELVSSDNEVFRFRLPTDNHGSVLDVHCDPEFWEAHPGVGTIHHIAFRARHDEFQHSLRKDLVGHGLNVTPQLNRKYFRSIYFREPSGVLFEIATDGPGFLIDETPDSLGQTLQLPEKYEQRRAEIMAELPEIRLPL